MDKNDAKGIGVAAIGTVTGAAIVKICTDGELRSSLIDSFRSFFGQVPYFGKVVRPTMPPAYPAEIAAREARYDMERYADAMDAAEDVEDVDDVDDDIEDDEIDEEYDDDMEEDEEDEFDEEDEMEEDEEVEVDEEVEAAPVAAPVEEPGMLGQAMDVIKSAPRDIMDVGKDMSDTIGAKLGGDIDTDAEIQEQLEESDRALIEQAVQSQRQA